VDRPRQVRKTVFREKLFFDRVSILTFCLSWFLGSPIQISLSAQEVVLQDPSLESAIREALNQSSGPLTVQILQGLNFLEAPRKSISNLDGLSAASNLEELDLSFNQLENLTLPSSLTNLSILRLRGNSLTNFSIARSGSLQKLTHLELSENQITNLSFLAQLPNLQTLLI